MAFIEKSFGGYVPEGRYNEEWQRTIENLYIDSGTRIEKGHQKEALELIFGFVRSANKYFDEQKPWAQFKENREACGYTLNACVQILANLANLLNPFIPFSCDKIRSFLGLEQPAWSLISVPANRKIQQLELLFERIDTSRIDEETSLLEKRGNGK